MNALLVSSAFGLGFLLTAGAWAQAPAGATATCKDGTYYTGTTHKGACRGHKGVKEWLNGGSSAVSGTAAATPETAATSKSSKKSKKTRAAQAAAPATTASAPAAAATAAKTTSSKHTAPTPASQMAAKPGGGPGLVWVNSGSKVYHCQGDEWYGKTKQGSYITEAAAKAAGNHAARGKECGK